MLIDQPRGEKHGKAHQEIRQLAHALGGGVQKAQQALDQQNQRALHRAHGEGAQEDGQVAEVELVEEHDRISIMNRTAEMAARMATVASSRVVRKGLRFALVMGNASLM